MVGGGRLRVAMLVVVVLLAAPPALAQAPGPDAPASPHSLLAEALAAREVPPGEASILVGAPRLGDQGRFEQTRDDEAADVTFAWRAEAFHDEWGRPVEGAKVAWTGGGGCMLTLTSDAGNASTTTRRGLDLFARYLDDERPVATGRPGSCVSGVLLGAEGVVVGSAGETVVAYGGWPAATCLFRHALQGMRVHEGARVPRVCAAWGEGEWFAGAVSLRRGFRAIPLHHVAQDDEGARVTRVWLAEGLAYPLEVERASVGEGEPGRAHHSALVALATGSEPLPATARAPPPTLDLRAPDRLLGPPDADARLPLRLSDAARAAVSDPTLRALQALLADPDAALAGASLHAVHPAGAPAGAPEWTLAFAAPGAAPVVVACAGEETPLGVAVARCREATADALARVGAPPSGFGAAGLPPRVAGFREALARWEALDANASGAPVALALYRPWSDDDHAAVLEIGTTAEDRPEAPGAPTRRESRARLDPASGRSVGSVQGFLAPLVVSDLPAGLPPPAVFSGESPAPAPAIPLLAAFGVAAAAGALVALALFWGAVKAARLGLYTRLLPGRALDAEARARIHEVVKAQPGVHAAAIMERLGRGNGVTDHHLQVLVREGILACVATDGFRRYFVAGRHSPAEMRAIAALQEGQAQALYRLIQAHPGILVGELARKAGISQPYASRSVKRLAAAGLVEAAREGRVVRLRALAPEAATAALRP